MAITMAAKRYIICYNAQMLIPEKGTRSAWSVTKLRKPAQTVR